jgi:hypothetical protein
MLDYQQFELIVLFCGPPALLRARLLGDIPVVSHFLHILPDLLQKILLAVGFLRILRLLVANISVAVVQDLGGQFLDGLAQCTELFRRLVNIPVVDREVVSEVCGDVHQLRQ